MLLAVIVIIAAAVAAAILAYMVWLAYRYRLDEQVVACDRLPDAFDGTTLLFISDVHRRAIPQELLEAVKAAGGADLVLIGGDLREKGVPASRIRGNIRRLLQIAPIYMVHGNHDYDEDIRGFEVLLEEERVRLLANESVILEKRDGSRIRLAGVDDPRTNHDKPELALADMEDGRGKLFTILLAHDPIIAKRLNGDEYVDLILSGHTHGGQVALPIIGPAWRGEDDSGYWRGWFQLAGKATKPQLFVSSGFGTSRLPIRLGTEAQLHRIILRSAHSSRN
ncbi:metallophosphoesterase [Paenibacillus sacheonensis]|uniref:Metallophosphoesterase n=1 Tax=Paenibacillus sacheonensis TaxID=742054 RepID=A0A7X5BXV3_9BACL|nr:metallophosphoesterase [Paenibacillus sacheonensis]MBM7564455.1 putative MPP superfamily phosphohydrolase [Paenibacillus sacheonensis]NBC69017.1 metallophosphoesterase [Paenibacillus sacheonensis]